METRLDHPEVLTDFEAASARRVRRWVVFCMVVWLLLMAGDWVLRFQAFRWQDQWLPPPKPATTILTGSEKGQTVYRTIPARQGAGLTTMLPISWIAKRYEEFHPEYQVPEDPYGYCNAPLPEGKTYDVLMLGDSFMLSLGTQNIAQVLAEISGVEVYNHARLGAGPFLQMRLFLWTDRFDPPPRVVVWNLTARDLQAHMFLKQSVDDWFDGWEDPLIGQIEATTRIQWNFLAPSELRKSWPNTSLMAYFSRRTWGQLKQGVFRGWPQDVLGADHPTFGPMLFYRENLRVLPLLSSEVDAPAVVQTAAKVARRFKERGLTLVVLLVPEKEQVYAQALSLEDQQALARGPALLSAIETGLKAEGIPVVNMMPAFQEATEQGTQVYWRDDTHWNDTGIRLAAEELWTVTEPLLQ
jgi:SGNH hydrolase-like domain, acetyltransferase AlgX